MNTIIKIELLFAFCLLLLIQGCKKENGSTDSGGPGQEEVTECTVTLLQGTAFVFFGDDDTKNDISVGDTLGENTTITTEADSTVEIQIGEGSVIRIKEQSKVRIATLFADEDQENTGLFLEAGKLLAEPELKSEESTFEVSTHTVTAGVRGTEFVIIEQPGKVTRIAVNEGKVSVKKEINIKNIETLKDLDQEVGKELEEALATEIILEPDEKLEVTEEKVKEIEEKVQAQVESIIEKLEEATEKSGDAGKEEIVRKDIESVNITEISAIVGGTIEKENVTDTEWQEEFNKQEFDEIKIRDTTTSQPLELKEVASLNSSFSRRDTYLTSADNNIYITNSRSNSVSCFNVKSGKISWVFTNPGSSKLGSPAVPYKKSVIVATFDAIYAVSQKNGSVSDTFPLENGPVFWAAPVVSNGKVYIPTSRKIYVYDGKSFSAIEKMPPAEGQMYINAAYNMVFINEGQARKIKVYNLVSGSLIYEPSGLISNSYMKPAVVENAFVIADKAGRIYKYDYGTKNTLPQVVKIDKGVISDIAVKDSQFYFIALDGKLYEISNDNFVAPRELALVEEKTDMNSQLVKNLVIHKNSIYYAANNGKVFTYSLTGKKGEFMNTPAEESLIGSPVVINDTLFVINTKGKVFSIAVEE